MILDTSNRGKLGCATYSPDNFRVLSSLRNIIVIVAFIDRTSKPKFLFFIRFDSTKQYINDSNVRLEFYDSDVIKTQKKIVSISKLSNPLSATQSTLPSLHSTQHHPTPSHTPFPLYTTYVLHCQW